MICFAFIGRMGDCPCIKRATSHSITESGGAGPFTHIRYAKWPKVLNMTGKAASGHRSLAVIISFECILLDLDRIINTQIYNSLAESIKFRKRLITYNKVDHHFIDICFNVTHNA